MPQQCAAGCGPAHKVWRAGGGSGAQVGTKLLGSGGDKHGPVAGSKSHRAARQIEEARVHGTDHKVRRDGQRRKNVEGKQCLLAALEKLAQEATCQVSKCQANVAPHDGEAGLGLGVANHAKGYANDIAVLHQHTNAVPNGHSAEYQCQVSTRTRGWPHQHPQRASPRGMRLLDAVKHATLYNANAQEEQR